MTQITKRFIGADQVDDSKIRLSNNAGIRSRNAAGTSDIVLLKGNAADIPEFSILPVVNSGLAVPSSLKQLATVEYVQNLVNAKGDVKDSVDYLADANVPLTGTVPLTIDSVAMVAGARVVLTGQTTGSQNGIYTVGIASTTYTLTRAVDANTSAQVTSGMFCMVTQGTVYQGYEVLLTTADPIVLDTTSLVFVKYPSTLAQVAGDMLSKTGNTWSVDLQALGGLESSSAGNIAGQLRVRTDQASLEKDKTTRLDSSTGAVAVKKSKKTLFTLISSDITNQFIDLADVAGDSSVLFHVAGGPVQLESVDYSVNYTGGTSSKTRVSFLSGLATGGASALTVGDVVVINYAAF